MENQDNPIWLQNVRQGIMNGASNYQNVRQGIVNGASNYQNVRQGIMNGTKLSKSVFVLFIIGYGDN